MRYFPRRAFRPAAPLISKPPGAPPHRPWSLTTALGGIGRAALDWFGPRRHDLAQAWAVFRADAEEIELRGLELEETHARLDAALNTMVHGLIMIDADMRVVLCNKQMRALFRFDPDIVRPGATMDQVIAHSIALGNHPGLSFGQVADEMRRCTADCLRASFQQTLPDGRLLAVHWEPMQGGGWVCTYEDITARVAATARVAHLARHDANTGLLNRVALQEAMLAAWPRRKLAGFNLLCLEIDRFQSINDTCGHRTGDILLQQCAERLGANVRNGDLVAHLGDASFAVLQFVPTNEDTATGLAMRVVEALQAPMPIDGRMIMATVSVGIATAQGGAPQTGVEEVLRNATLALHRAATDGGDKIRVYAPDMDRRAQARHALEIDLRGALAAGQFEIHYQPLVSVAQRRVTGFEALLRWHHPVRGLVSPAVFIPLAEELGLIGAIGGWALRTACTEAATWPEPVRVAINLSPLQFTSGPSLSDIVAEALALSGLPGGRLELEITESVPLQNDATTLETLHRLHGLGASIALDDFGTGYSSLSYLRCFPFDKLKIDQSFVRGLPEAESAAIVRAIVALGASLGIDTVAEGVELESQLTALVAEACDEMQGYLFSPPRPAADIPALLSLAATRIAA